MSKKKFELGPLQKMWVESLKAHPERQTKGILGKGSARYYKACCLGELHLCYHRIKKIKLPFGSSEFIDNEGSMGALLNSYDKYGLWDGLGKLKEPYIREGRIIDSLAAMNDYGVSWHEIADYIQSNPENVFTYSV